jgi:hypothetical protein
MGLRVEMSTKIILELNYYLKNISMWFIFNKIQRKIRYEYMYVCIHIYIYVCNICKYLCMYHL